MFHNKNRGRARRAVLACMLALSLLRRLLIIARLPRNITLIVHREAFPFFTPRVEEWARRRAARLILDVDDAMYVAPTHVADWRRRLRNPAGFERVLSLADTVFAGSPSMVERAHRAGSHAMLRPTLPPPDIFTIERQPCSERIILWTGSYSTLGSLAAVLPDVLRACEAVGATLHVVGGQNVLRLAFHPLLQVHEWSQEIEMQLLKCASLGLMPLPANEWEAGKSAYKLLLYMAAGVPALASDVGMNRWLAERAPGVRLVESNGDWRQSVAAALGDDKFAESGSRAREWLSETLLREYPPAAAVAAIMGD